MRPENARHIIHATQPKLPAGVLLNDTTTHCNTYLRRVRQSVDLSNQKLIAQRQNSFSRSSFKGLYYAK